MLDNPISHGRSPEYLRAANTSSSRHGGDFLRLDNIPSSDSSIHRHNKPVLDPWLILAFWSSDGNSVGPSISLNALHCPGLGVAKPFAVAVVVYRVDDALRRAASDIYSVVTESHLCVATVWGCPDTRCRGCALGNDSGIGGGEEQDGGENVSVHFGDRLEPL